MLVDDHLPSYDVSDTVAVEVHADPGVTWDALLDADLLQVGWRAPLAGTLGALRLLPQTLARVLRGESVSPRTGRMTLKDTASQPREEGGWVLLGEDPERHELALGLVGRFWRPVIVYADVPAEAFTGFSAPGYAKTVYALRVEPLDDERCLLSATMRTATTDEHARRWFRRYWTFGVGAGAHVVVQALLEMVREAAEAAVPVGAGS